MRVKPTLIFSNSSSHIPKKMNTWFQKLSRDEEDRKDVLIEELKMQVKDSKKEFSEIEISQTPEEKGTEEAVKSHAVKAEKNRQAVEDMVSNSNRILLRISSVFPWDFFPTSIVVEETRVTIIHRQFLSAQVHSVDVKNISNVFVDTSILFSKITIVSDTFAENQIIISRLWKKDAIFLRRIVEGLRMFVNKDIDTTGYEVEELKRKLGELSTTGIVL